MLVQRSANLMMLPIIEIFSSSSSQTNCKQSLEASEWVLIFNLFYASITFCPYSNTYTGHQAIHSSASSVEREKEREKKKLVLLEKVYICFAIIHFEHQVSRQIIPMIICNQTRTSTSPISDCICSSLFWRLLLLLLLL